MEERQAKGEFFGLTEENALMVRIGADIAAEVEEENDRVTDWVPLMSIEEARDAADAYPTKDAARQIRLAKITRGPTIRSVAKDLVDGVLPWKREILLDLAKFAEKVPGSATMIVDELLRLEGAPADFPTDDKTTSSPLFGGFRGYFIRMDDQANRDVGEKSLSLLSPIPFAAASLSTIIIRGRIFCHYAEEPNSKEEENAMKAAYEICDGRAITVWRYGRTYYL